MSDVSLRLNTTADTAQIRSWASAVREATSALSGLGSAVGNYGGGGGGGGGGGAPLPSGGPSGGPSGAPLPPPPSGAGWGRGGGGNPWGGMPGGSGPPLPPPPAGTGNNGSSPYWPNSAPPNYVPNSQPPPPAGGGGQSGGEKPPGNAQRDSGGSDWSRKAWNWGSGYLYQQGNQMQNLGLGAGFDGFALASGQKYLELSKIMAVVHARFRDSAQSAMSFGGAMGYTLATTAGLVEALGNVNNTVNRSDFLRGTGFARYMGLDPHSTLGTTGRIGHLTGKGSLSNNQFAEIAGRAAIGNMGQGRMEEELSVLRSQGEQMFQSTGSLDFRALMATHALSGIVFGANNPAGQGQDGASLVSGLNSVLKNPTSSAFMMRAMGYGGPGGPGYIEMRKRIESGVNDPRNVVDLFKAFKARGLSQNAMFRALEGVSGGSLTAWQIEALVGSLGTDEGMKKYQEVYASQDEGLNRFISDSGAKNPDMAKLGKKNISEGDARDVKLEQMQMGIGKYVAGAMEDMTDVIKSIFEIFKSLSGVNLGELLVEFTRTMKKVSHDYERYSKGGNPSDLPVTFTDDTLTDDEAAKILSAPKKLVGAFTPAGGGSRHTR